MGSSGNSFSLVPSRVVLGMPEACARMWPYRCCPWVMFDHSQSLLLVFAYMHVVMTQVEAAGVKLDRGILRQLYSRIAREELRTVHTLPEQVNTGTLSFF